MNTSALILLIEHTAIAQAILMLYIIIAIFLAGYNWLYMYHSVHVTTKHMGIDAPNFIKTIIQIAILLALFSAFASSILLAFSFR